MQLVSASIRGRYALLAVAGFLAVVLIQTYHASLQSGFQVAKNKAHRFNLGGSTARATQNETLGFQEIMYISMDGLESFISSHTHQVLMLNPSPAAPTAPTPCSSSPTSPKSA
jgi:hypothetical protein